MKETLTIDDLIGKTIKYIDADGYGITILTQDGVQLVYDASDGGYSAWEINYENSNTND